MKSPFLFVVIVTLTTPALAETPRTPLRDAANREAAHIVRTAGPAAQQAAQSEPRSWPARHPVLTGALIGAGFGFAIGAATCKYPTAEGSSCSDYTFPGNARLLGGVTIGLYGAAIGAGVGALVGLSRR